MANRPKIPSEIESSVLIESRRHCCLCFWLEGIDSVQKGQIAHLDDNRENNKKDNLAFLCFNHHDEYDSKRSQAKGLTKKEVKSYRKELYLEMEYRFKSISNENKVLKVKNTLKFLAKEGLEMRLADPIQKDMVEEWDEKCSNDLKKIGGEVLKFDFQQCLEGCGKISFEVQDDLKAFLNIKSRFLKDTANTIDVTDIIK